jgi:tetratricopeptide (TPR) repeat protein
MSLVKIALTAAASLVGVALAQTSDPASAARRADELLAAGKLDEAVGIYQNLVRASPNNPALLLNLSIAEYKGKRYSDAVAHASAALKLQPDLLPARLFQGAGRLELGDFAGAVEPLEIVIASNPQERNARLMLGDALLGIGKPAAAVEHLVVAAELLPASSRVWYGLGHAYEALGQNRAASEAWDRLLSLPPSVQSHQHTAQVNDAAQRWREAAVEWRAALALAPENRLLRTSLGWALFRARDYEVAMDALKSLLNSEAADIQFIYGACLLNLQQPVAAIHYLRAAIARDARLMPARAALGQGLLQTGNAEEAIPLLRDAASVDADGNVHFQLFRAYQITHRETEARQALAAYQRLRASLPATVP